jgi:hypothetical protein
MERILYNIRAVHLIYHDFLDDKVKNFYFIPVMVVGGLSFLAIWLYALIEWGILFGFLFGWLPAAIGGAALGFFWPATLLFVFWVLQSRH